MKKITEKDLTIRSARPEDVASILVMVHELADFECLADEVVATEADYQESLFGEKPVAEALVAIFEGQLIGYAIFFSTFSTFIGRAGLWLEDLYVRSEFRRQGVGRKLLKAGGEIARERGAGRYEWSVLDWNRNAIDLYEQMGGEIMEEWRIVRLDRGAVETLSEK
ncbi:MAG: GNAT family N-acetyltransferase [Verrucomicrobiales bacterium]|nr:GNAT family N-acetyltransferase [Verrucomicrobiales bacterium]